ncbi:SDR family NAD(P)-dependent oxidoreductase [Diaminobutyricibacter sp. McL0618]|uniref:SDR family NAD(P)-dependent oxidoreductase n=1 Tax=Leifsonia sp. McL0618 TaxID=3415677 RepID=UPI003CFADB8C
MRRAGALVIGASSAIGIAIARTLARDGASVVGVSIEPFVHPDFLSLLQADCSQPDEVDRVVSAAFDALGSIDIVVLAAASMPVASAATTTDELWHKALGATLDSAFFVVRAALPHLRRGAAIVAVSSSNARVTVPGIPGYAAAKAGLEGLVRQLAVEYGPAGIRVNAVAPGMIGSSELPGVTEGYPLGRTGTPEDVAEAVAFLASDRSTFITGAVLPVDGGLTIGSPAAWLRPDLRQRWQ